MFVKWQKRRSTRADEDLSTYWQSLSGDLLMASVVESKRVNGEPRHKLITYLGSIRENHAQGGPEGAVWQDDFWQHVAKKLNQAKNRITTEDRTKIEAALAKRVRQPTRAEVNQLLANARKKLAKLVNIHGAPMYPNPTKKKVRDHARWT